MYMKGTLCKWLFAAAAGLAAMPLKAQDNSNIYTLVLDYTYEYNRQNVSERIAKLDYYPELKELFLINIDDASMVDNGLKKLKLTRNLVKFSAVNTNFTKLPTGIDNHRNMAVIRVDRSSLSRIPKEISEFRKLDTLQMSHCNIRSMPDEIGRINNLRYLNLNYDSIRTINQELPRLNRLVELHLAGNLYNKLPDGFGNLRSLEVLDISHSNFRKPEQEWEKIGQLRKLRVLNLAYCNIVKLPAPIAALDNLEELDLRGNHLEDLPGDFSNMINLKRINISDNQFTAEKVAALKSRLPDVEIIEGDNLRQ